MAFLAGCSELGGGVLVASGLAFPAGALAVAAVVLTAAVVVQTRNGFWNQNGGVESTLLIWAAAVALATIGPGRFSLDASIGWADSLSGVWWGVGVAAISILATAANARLGRSSDSGRTLQPVVDEAPRRAA